MPLSVKGVDPDSEFSFRTRAQAWSELKNNPDRVFSAVIVGGGIVGAGILRELALRGVSDVVLIEKNDFASGTSGASSKLIHAGIRYLEQAWRRLLQGRLREAFRYFYFVLQASQERKVLGRMAPHLIKPKSICLVLGRSDRRNILSVAAGVWFYYAMQLFQGQKFTPPKFYLTRRGIQRKFPELNANRIKAVFTFWDAQTDDARLVIENVRDAHARGAWAFNYVEVIGFERTADGFAVSLIDKETGEHLSVKARVLINAAGPFVDEVRSREKGKAPADKWVDRVAGCHLNVAPPLAGESFYITAKDNRLVFVLSRNEDGFTYSRIGTTERALVEGESCDSPQATAVEIEYLTNLAQEYFLNANLTPQSLVSVDAGVRPLQAKDQRNLFEKTREHDIREENGIYHIVGVKLTDYRRVAHELMARLPFQLGPSRLSRTPFPVSNQVYEDNISDTLRRTLVLHWPDFVLRRRGLKPLWSRKKNPDEFRSQFAEVARLMGWGVERQKMEYRQISDSPPFSFDS